MSRAFTLYLSGTEVPVHRKLLREMHVPHVGLNYLHLRPRLPLHKEWLLKSNYPAGQAILLDSGAFGVNKKDWTVEAHEEYLGAYLDFVQANIDRLNLFTECDFMQRGRAWIEHQRDELWSALPAEKFIPIWHESFGHRALAQMIERYPNVGVSPMSKSMENRVAALVRRSSAQLHGLGFAHPSEAPGALYASISSTSWISPMMHGETIVWDHNRLRRYPSDQKELARRRHRVQFEQAGFDSEAILADDNHELARYTVWAWLQMEAAMQGPQRVRRIRRLPVEPEVSNSNGHVPSSGVSDLVAAAVAHLPTDMGSNPDLLPARIEDMKVLPSMGFVTRTTVLPATDDRDEESVSTRLQTSVQLSQRKCSSCSLAELCPEFDTDRETCAFSMPVEIHTHDQLLAACTAMLEMQMQRVGFARFSEELNGGYPDQNLSAEMDRWMSMVLKVKEVEDNRDMLKVNVEARGAAGVLSQIFGSRATAPLRSINPDQAEQAVRRVMKP